MSQETKKITVRLTQEQGEQLEERVPWGYQDKIFRAMVDSLIEAHEAYGNDLFYAIERGEARVQFQMN